MEGARTCSCTCATEQQEQSGSLNAADRSAMVGVGGHALPPHQAEVGMDVGGQAKRGRHETRRLGDTAGCPKKKKPGSAVCGGRGQEHKDAPVEAFNDRNTSSDSSSESDGENRFFEELHFNFRKKTSSSANKSSYM